MKVSIVIPALNEEKHLPATLDSCERQTAPYELVVADGGSSDRTTELAAGRCKVVSGTRGRAAQMNAGAAASSGDVLLFLHADTRLPGGALTAIRTAVRSGAEAGNFRLAFDQRSPLLDFYAWCTRFEIPSFSFGDRSLFVVRDVFADLGGYRPISIFEDLELARALARRGHFSYQKDAVVTSARRFSRNGHLRQQLMNAYLWVRYRTGAEPESVADLYRYPD